MSSQKKRLASTGGVLATDSAPVPMQPMKRARKRAHQARRRLPTSLKQARARMTIESSSSSSSDDSDSEDDYLYHYDESRTSGDTVSDSDTEYSEALIPNYNEAVDESFPFKPHSDVAPPELIQQILYDETRKEQKVFSSDKELTEGVHGVLSKLYPDYSQTTDPERKSEFEKLVRMTKSFVKKRGQSDTKNKHKSFESTTKCVCEAILEAYPSRSFAQLIGRWSRKKRGDFPRECFNLAVVLKQHFNRMSIAQLIKWARDFQVEPKNLKRTKWRCSYIKHGKAKPGHKGIEVEDVVSKLDCTLMLLYAGIDSQQQLNITKLGMQSVKTYTSFQLPLCQPKVVPNDEDEDEDQPSSTKQSTSLRFNTLPSMAYHLPDSFSKRLWLHIKTLSLAYNIYDILFGKYLAEGNYYSEQGFFKDEKVLQFLLTTTHKQKSRYMFTKLLFDICIYFETSHEPEISYKYFFDKCVHDQYPNDFVTEVKQNASYAEVEILSRMQQPYASMADKCKQFKFSTFLSKDRERAYQILRMFVFNLWLKSFRSNKYLRTKFEGKAVEDFDAKTSTPAKPVALPDLPTNDGATDTPHPAAGPPPPSLPASPPITLPTLESMLCTTDVDEEEAGADDEEADYRANIANDDSSTAATGHEIFESFGSGDYGIISPTHLKRKVRSVFEIYAPTQRYALELAPLEIYLASYLVKYSHLRRTTLKPKDPSFLSTQHYSQACTIISSNVPSFFDENNDVLSVVRLKSEIMNRRFNRLKLDLCSLMKLCIKRGSAPKDDDLRRPSSTATRVLDFGIKAELQRKGTAEGEGVPIYGSQHFQPGDDMTDKEIRLAKDSLANIVDYIWYVSSEVQRTLKKAGLGGNIRRKKLYGAVLGAMLGTSYQEFEAVTLVVTVLFPIPSHLKEHVDPLNDKFYSYCKTCAMDLVVVDSKTGYVFLVQVLCNFRNAVRHRVSPQTTTVVQSVIKNMKAYEGELCKRYNQVWIEKANQPLGSIPTSTRLAFLENPSDLTDFFLDESLNFEERDIYRLPTAKELRDKFPGRVFQPVRRKLLTLPIGTSRITSYSTLLSAFYDLGQRPEVCLDEIVGLIFFSCFAASHILFSEAIEILIQEIKDGTYTVAENGHPFYRVRSILLDRFPTFQSGIEPRFKSSSNKILEAFGDDPTNTENVKRLQDVTRALFLWIDEIDSHHGKESAEQIPFADVQAEMIKVLKQVRDAQKPINDDDTKTLDFAMFRLSVFTTMVSALKIVKSGPHLFQMVIPTKGASASNHLTTELSELNSLPKLSHYGVIPDVETEKYNKHYLIDDDLMQNLSASMDWKEYKRAVVEIYLCESAATRYLDKKDVFVHDKRIFWMKDDGTPVFKEFGSRGRWIPCAEPIKSYRFLKDDGTPAFNRFGSRGKWIPCAEPIKSYRFFPDKSPVTTNS